MIKFFWCFFMCIIISDSCLAGVSVVGTRFFIDDSTKSLNIKVINDNDSDYLIKTTINNDGFIISPPLFILPKNRSNIITVIPDEKIKSNKDDIYSLTITTIPRSEISAGNNVVSLAIRSHFNLISRHKLPADKDFNEIKLTRSPNGKWFLTNPTHFALMIFLSKDKLHEPGNTQLLVPGQQIPVNKYCDEYTCSLWLNIVDEENHIVKKLNLISD